MSDVEVHRIGLTQLPGHNVTAGANQIHIIFLHGLKGHPRTTWEGVRTEAIEAPAQKRSWTSKPFSRAKPSASSSNSIALGHSEMTLRTRTRKVFWPFEFLVPDFRERAIIWMYGYNADLIGGIFQANNQNSVHQHGRDLAIQVERQISEGIVVFVAHSLGGIVVKDALCRSKICRDRTRMVVFLGTPHRGSSFAAWGKIASDLARFARQDSNRGLLETLEVNSKILDDIQTRFEKIAMDLPIRIHSFQEGRGMSGIIGLHNKIVDDYSSKIGLGSLECVETIDADHREIARCSSRSDPQYRAIFGVLNQFVHRTIQAAESKFFVPYYKNDGFVGRKSELEMLKKCPLDTPSQPRIGVFGLGGVGKTQLAIQYVYWLRKACPECSIFWVHAGNPDRFREGFVSLARRCQIPGCEEPKANVPLLVKRWLENEEKSGRWLMVLDNADDMKMFRNQRLEDEHDNTTSGCTPNVRQYIPECPHGALLITTRDKKTGLELTKGTRLIELGIMSEDDSAELLSEKLQEPDLEPNILSALSLRLDYMPLALVQAAMFISRNGISVKQYIYLLERNDEAVVELLSQGIEALGNEGSTAVASTWILSFEQVQQENDFARDLLSLMSCFDRQAIPFELLLIYNTRYRVSHGRQGARKTELDLLKALGQLRRFSFILEDRHGQYSMHRTVQLITQRWLANANKLEEFAHQALMTVSEAYPRHSHDPKNWDQSNLALVYAGQGRISESLQLNLTVVEDFKSLYGGEHPNTVTGMCNLAKVYCDQDRWLEAETLLGEVLDVRRRVLGEEHPDTIKTSLDLGAVYLELGRYQKAEDMLVHGLASAKMLFGEEHPDSLFGTKSLGILHVKQGRYERAEMILQRAWEVEKQVLGQEHGTFMGTSNCLARTKYLMGKFQEAEAMFQVEYVWQKRIYGEQHPNTLAVLRFLARTHLWDMIIQIQSAHFQN
ncbi:hypothetical protein V8F20_002640 [Naviculisporaceae sp. PSN 640]